MLLIKSNISTEKLAVDESKLILSYLNGSFGISGDAMLLLRGNFGSSLREISPARLQELCRLLSLLPANQGAPEFGSWVERARSALNLKQADLARWIGVGRDRICKLEANKSQLSNANGTALRNRLIIELRKANLI